MLTSSEKECCPPVGVRWPKKNSAAALSTRASCEKRTKEAAAARAGSDDHVSTHINADGP